MSKSIIVCGQTQAFADQTLGALLASRGIDPARPGIAVAVNARVVPRRAWPTTRLAPDDQIEIVEAKAGG